MKRLTLLTLLASALVTAPLHSEPTSVDALLPAVSAFAPRASKACRWRRWASRRA